MTLTVAAVLRGVVTVPALLLGPVESFVSVRPSADEELPAVSWLVTSTVGDDVVPSANVLRFADAHRAELTLVDAGHRLNDQRSLATLAERFDALLARVPAG